MSYIDKIKKIEYLETIQGRFYELTYWKSPLDKVRLKSKEYSDSGAKWEHQNEYDPNDVMFIEPDFDEKGESGLKVNYEVTASNGGVVGTYKDRKDFIRFVKYYLLDVVVNITEVDLNKKNEFYSLVHEDLILKFNARNSVNLEYFYQMINYIAVYRYELTKELQKRFSEMVFSVALICNDELKQETLIGIASNYESLR